MVPCRMYMQVASSEKCPLLGPTVEPQDASMTTVHSSHTAFVVNPRQGLFVGLGAHRSSWLDKTRVLNIEITRADNGTNAARCRGLASHHENQPWRRLFAGTRLFWLSSMHHACLWISSSTCRCTSSPQAFLLGYIGF